MAVDVFNKYALDYQRRFMDFDLYNDTFDLFCESISRHPADVLELGCGPGNITRYLLSKRPDLKILATDLASNMLDLGRINNPHAEFQEMDCRNMSKLAVKYDGIMCGFCLPYLSKEEAVKLISDASLLLHSGGILYLSTMEDDYSKSGLKGSSACADDKAYIHYHQADYLSAALEANGFRIISMQRKDFPSTDETPTTDLIILAVSIQARQ
ncbi:MAG TPA: class I SAM-dependent methyltransferase [Bacteroidia bacterium]|nr:class I SAM-dependent methyltransferase [Bacteroidia bacterium]